MARIRTIKPEFFTSEDIVSLSPLARLLYVATWCEADKEGRLVWKPATFKLRYLPGDNCDINALCDELVNAGLIVLYGDGLAYVPSFKAHQHLNPRESESQLPVPTRGPRVPTRQPRVVDAQGGREGKGREGKDKPPALPAGFVLFWEAWPNTTRKAAKRQCCDKWVAMGCEAMTEKILAAVATAKRSDAWRKDKGQFIPAPLVWLNQERWEAPPPEEFEAGEWHETRSGIEAKGVELGLGSWDERAFSIGEGDPWPVYQARVYKAAGFIGRVAA
jgi:hypothetical protein